MDEVTKKQIRYGEGLMNILKQKPSSPMKQVEQVFMLVIATMDRFETIDPQNALSAMKDIVKDAMAACPDIVMKIENEGTLSDEDMKRIYDSVTNRYV